MALKHAFIAAMFLLSASFSFGQLEETPLDVPPGMEEYHKAESGSQDWHEPNPKAARHRRRSDELRAREDHPVTTFIVDIVCGVLELFGSATAD